MRCPNCLSTRSKEFDTGRFRCLRCGREWWNPSMHKIEIDKDSRLGGVNTNAIPLVDYHNIVYKFNIVKDNPEVHLPNSKRMRGWVQEWDEMEGVKFQRTPLSVIVFLNKRLKNKLSSVETEGLALIKKYAEIFQEKYGIILNTKEPIPIRKEIKLLEGFRSADQFQGDKVKCVYSDGRIEFIDKNKAIEHTKNFIESLAVESKADMLADKMDGGFDTLAYLLTQQNEILKMNNSREVQKSSENPLLKPLENLLNTAIKIKREIE